MEENDGSSTNKRQKKKHVDIDAKFVILRDYYVKKAKREAENKKLRGLILEVATTHNISRRTLSQWIHKADERGGIQRKQGSGRKPKIKGSAPKG